MEKRIFVLDANIYLMWLRYEPKYLIRQLTGSQKLYWKISQQTRNMTLCVRCFFLAEQHLSEKRIQNQPSGMEELQRRALKAEEENAALREQVRQLEAQRAEHEVKMKLMEEMWQKQISSLQVSFLVSYGYIVVLTRIDLEFD